MVKNIFLQKHVLAVGCFLYFCVSSVYANGFAPQLQVQNHWYKGGNTVGAGIMLPYQASTNLPFVDVRHYQDRHHNRTTSVGIGYRRSFGDNNTSWVGANAYFDAIHSKEKKRFNHASVGLEWVSPAVDASANMYFPIGTSHKELSAQDTAVINDGYLGVNTSRQYEKLGRSADAEIGVPIMQNANPLKAYVGGYWQERKGRKDNQGARARLDWTVNQAAWLPSSTSLSIGAYAGYDKEQHGLVGLQFKLRFGKGSTSQQTIFREVNRQLTFNTHQYTTQQFERANNYGKVAKVSLRGDMDVNKLNTAIAAVGNKGVALLEGEGWVNDSIIIPDNRTILGNNSSLNIQTPSGKKATFVYQAPQTTITSTNMDKSVLQVGSNVTVENVNLVGGKTGISNLHETSQNIKLSRLNIKNTAGDGIRLDGVNGIQLNSISIRDLAICENNSDCEYSVVRAPDRVPHSAFAATGSSDISIKDFSAENVTYGIFVSSKMEGDYVKEYDVVAKNINIDTAKITNTRREGLLLVGVDGANIRNYTVDNSQRVKSGEADMDLIVLQASRDVNLDNTTLIGGINGLMIVNSPNLPKYETNNYRIKGLTSKDNSFRGVFINPASDISLEDVTIDNAGKAGMLLMGSQYSFIGGPTQNVELKNVSINNPKNAVLTVYGPIKNLSGDIKTTGKADICQKNPWMGASLTQEAGKVLRVNGSVVDSFENCVDESWN
ncbi:hypothetical protein AAEX37_00219 [Oligella sp. MSHR50489EDL]